jgi:DNA-binding MarR family transcriptional regulator
MPSPIANSDSLSLPALLRAARRTYARAIGASMREAGFGDIPRNGLFVIGAISRTAAPLSEIIKWLDVSKQAAGQLVDTLVVRGYLARTIDEEDRRKLTVALTDRGQVVASIARAAVERVEERLHEAVGSRHVAHTRATLLALSTLACD